MISDVLFEARTQIAWYLERFPETYAEMQAEILTLCAAMERVQVQLDNPFTPEEMREMLEGDL